MTARSPDTRRRLLIDLETYSSADLTKTGVFKYVEAPDFAALLLAYAYDHEPVKVIDMMDRYAGLEEMAEATRVLNAICDPNIVKVAHNSAFERACLSKFLDRDMPPEEWEDSMIMAAMNGLPMSLDAAGAALRLKDQKIKEGTSLISYFCKPCRPTISNGGRTRNLPEHAPDKWERFIEYNRRDVEVEQAIYWRLKGLPVTEFERRIWAIDARINERGVLIDTDLAQAAVNVDEAFKETHTAEMKQLTGLENPNSVAQLKTWLDSVGVPAEAVTKAAVSDLLGQELNGNVRRVLELRQLLGKTSTKKYQAMLDAACLDHRVRGIMQYYGAGRTGRWAGRIVQPQNLPQNHLAQIGDVREIVRSQDLASLELVFDSVPDVLSQLIRTAIIAPEGKTLLVADFSAIEARVIAYLAGEQWRMDTFANGGDIYCASASAMFKVPVEKHGQNSHLRQKGKIAELACGYGGGIGALKAFGADKMGLSDEELQDIVTQWRQASPTIPRFWSLTEKAAQMALYNPGNTYSVGSTGQLRKLRYRKDADALRLVLPSGRILSYWNARLEDGSIVFDAQNQTTRQWEKTQTWGGKLVENIVQAVARDCLAVSIDRLTAAGYDIIFHVHDEIIAEVYEDERWEDMAEIMGQPIDWAPGLLLRADGYSTKYYRKD